MSDFSTRTVIHYTCVQCGTEPGIFCEQCKMPICEKCSEYAVDYAIDVDCCYFHRKCWPELFDGAATTDSI
jgi:hypothetical protein